MNIMEMVTVNNVCRFLTSGLYGHQVHLLLPVLSYTTQTELDDCIVWNAHNTILGSERWAICALAVYIVHLTRPKI